MRPLTKETVEMARQGLLMSDWCGFSKRDTVNQLCDLALKGLSITRPEALSATRFNVLNEVHQRLHDMKNLQRASAWPHVEGVARAEKMVWDMIAACQPNDSITPSPLAAGCGVCHGSGWTAKNIECENCNADCSKPQLREGSK